MNASMRTFVLAGLIAAVSLLGGCIKVRQTLTLMPDGSGAIDLRVGMSAQLIAMAQQQGEDPFGDLDPDELMDQAEGIVAISEPVMEEADGYTFMSFRAYFTDINEVSMPGMNEGGGDATEFVYERDGDSGTLTVANSMMTSMTAEYEKPADEDVQFMRAMMTGLSFEEHYVLPGAVTAPDGLEADGNRLEMEVTLDNMIEGDGIIAALDGVEELELQIGADSVEDSVVEEFAAELEAAVEAWENREEDE